MKGKSIGYSDLELAFLKVRADWPRRDLHAKFCAVFGRTDVTADAIKAVCLRHGWKTGRTGQFPKGQTPPNKGQPMPYHPNSAATRFKHGELNGRARAIYKPIGAERLSREGYLQRKVSDVGPPQRRWKTVQLIRWQEVNGPLPAGSVLKCLDGDKLNTDPSNWLAIPRAMLPRLNGKCGRDFDNAPAELKPTILATAHLEQRAFEIRKDRADG